MTGAGFPHSDTPGSTLRCQLPRAYRRLVRPSSALDAKASTMCPSQLVSQTLNKNNKRHTPPPAQSHQQQGHYKTKDNNPPTNQEKNPDQPHWLSPDARVHYPHIKHPTHQPHPPAHSQQATKEAQNKQTPPPGETPQGRFAGLIPQGPTVCQSRSGSVRSRFHTRTP